MVRHQASDLFFSPGTPVHIKIEGVTRPIGETPASVDFCREAVYSVLDQTKAREFESTLEVDLAITLGERARFRVNCFHQRGQPAMVLRYVRATIPTPQELGLPPILTRLIMHKRGIILMVGATGSGKSTTLAAMIEHRNASAPGHILTIEDPIEFIHPHRQCIVNQREIGIDTFSYAAALRSSLREAPDVILIGEIRDRETMEAAIELAGTGHLAISTLHANNAHQAMQRIVNMFPQDMHKTLFLDLSITMRAVISQRLVRTVGGRRCAAVEVLVNTPHIADLIRDGQIDEVATAMQTSTEEGMKTFDDALLELFRAGIITFEEALANADSAPNLEAKIHFS